ncbi:MAG: hypothetical protein IGNPGNKH_00773 [Sodalis sp. Ffu]|nr:MAG: hypothetical protein IGNPGNKH_00773 [Sodalis sp. Ffu]
MNNTSTSGFLCITKLQYLKLRGKGHGGGCAFKLCVLLIDIFKKLLHLLNSESIFECFKI